MSNCEKSQDHQIESFIDSKSYSAKMLINKLENKELQKKDKGDSIANKMNWGLSQ